MKPHERVAKLEAELAEMRRHYRRATVDCPRCTGPCPRDTDGDGDCGQRHCPICGVHRCPECVDGKVPAEGVKRVWWCRVGDRNPDHPIDGVWTGTLGDPQRCWYHGEHDSRCGWVYIIPARLIEGEE